MLAPPNQPSSSAPKSSQSPPSTLLTWTPRQSAALVNCDKSRASPTIVIVRLGPFTAANMLDSGAATSDSCDFGATAMGTWT